MFFYVPAHYHTSEDDNNKGQRASHGLDSRMSYIPADTLRTLTFYNLTFFSDFFIRNELKRLLFLSLCSLYVSEHSWREHYFYLRQRTLKEDQRGFVL